MVEFLDGPAAGKALALRRAPILLRVVVGPHGRVDALDQLDDEPAPDERVHVYRREPGTWGTVFVRPGGRFAMGTYRHLPDVDGDRLRDTGAWRTWAESQPVEEVRAA